MRVRASAGAASYRRRSTLERFLDEAEAQVEALKAELDDDPAATSRRIAAARERAASERTERVRRALRHLPELEAAKRRAGKPVDEARVMKMADGGYRPAYNVQFAADTESQVIVGLDVSTAGTDHGQLGPMVRQLHGRYGRDPDALLADAGFLTTAEINELACGTTLYLPVRTPADPIRDPHQPLPDDSPAVAAWRVRMGTAEAKELYKDRAATAECVNAIARNRGLQRFGVRGPDKARAIALWFALAHNLMRTFVLRAAPAAT